MTKKFVSRQYDGKHFIGQIVHWQEKGTREFFTTFSPGGGMKHFEIDPKRCTQNN